MQTSFLKSFLDPLPLDHLVHLLHVRDETDPVRGSLPGPLLPGLRGDRGAAAPSSARRLLQAQQEVLPAAQEEHQKQHHEILQGKALNTGSYRHQQQQPIRQRKLFLFLFKYYLLDTKCVIDTLR